MYHEIKGIEFLQMRLIEAYRPSREWRISGFIGDSIRFAAVVAIVASALMAMAWLRG